MVRLVHLGTNSVMQRFSNLVNLQFNIRDGLMSRKPSLSNEPVVVPELDSVVRQLSRKIRA